MKINYSIVQLVLLALVISYGIALLCGVSVPAANKEAFAGIWAVIIVLLNPDKLRDMITAADTPPGASDNTPAAPGADNPN